MATESPVVNNLVGSVGFNRKISVRQYESAEAWMNVQFDIDAENVEQTIANAKAAMFQAKAMVFEELGLEFKVENGVIQEILNDKFGKVTEVRSTPAATAAPAAAPAAVAAGDHPATQPFPSDTADKDQRQANKDWAVIDIAQNPSNWWDNRTSKRNPKAPDYKHKETGLAVWVS